MPIIAMLVGATLGFWLGHNFDGLVGGGFVGLIAGLIVHQFRKRAPAQVVDPAGERFAAIEARLARLESMIGRAGVALQRRMPDPVNRIGAAGQAWRCPRPRAFRHRQSKHRPAI
jgi:hypothetical protein